NCEETMKNWQKTYTSKDLPCPIQDELSILSLKNVSTTIFNHLSIDDTVVHERLNSFFPLMEKKTFSPNRFPWIFPSKSKRAFYKEMTYLQNVLKEAILSRIKSGKDYDDLLGTLLTDYKITNQSCPLFTKSCHQIKTFYAAGYFGPRATLLSVVVHLAQ